MSDELCGVCNQNREAHAALNHEFNAEGRLVPKIKPKPARQSGQQIEVLIAFNRLLTLLQAKGLIDERDLIFLATGVHHGGLATSRPGPDGDLAAGAAEETG